MRGGADGAGPDTPAAPLTLALSLVKNGERESQTSRPSSCWQSHFPDVMKPRNEDIAGQVGLLHGRRLAASSARASFSPFLRGEVPAGDEGRRRRCQS